VSTHYTMFMDDALDRLPDPWTTVQNCANVRESCWCTRTSTLPV